MKTKYFEIEKTRYRSYSLVLSSGDGEEYAGCKLRFGIGTIHGIIHLPPIIKPHQISVFPNWDIDTIKRLGKDYYYKYTRKEYGISFCDTYVNVAYGLQNDDSDLISKQFGFFVPWLMYTYLGITYFNIDGTVHKWIPQNRGDFEATSQAKSEVSKVAFLVRDYDGEQVVAICHIEERQWHRGIGICSWLKYITPIRVRKILDIEFSSDVGERKTTWKGGTIAHSIELLLSESPESAMKRYCDQNNLTFLSTLTELTDEVKLAFSQRYGPDYRLIP